jgi:pilus assembly protein CpaF
VPADVADLLAAVVDRRLALLISGGTGSGKTTLLNALLTRVHPDERVLVVEDTAELRPDHPHVVSLEARPANIEGSGRVDLRTLVRQALRMRPDRVVVGEVRGDEVVDFLAALNTGHDGGACTIHANSTDDVVARLEGLALAAGLPQAALHAQVAAALDVLVHCGRDRRGRRRVSAVSVLERDDDGRVRAVPALTVDADGRTCEHQGAAVLARRLQGS